MKKLINEFKEFAMGGNLIEIAVALVLALAFVAVINALVTFLIMPIIGIIFGQPTFDSLTVTINDSIIFYGSFLTAVVIFVLTALALFLFVVKPYQAYRARYDVVEEPVFEAEEVVLLREIRDSLRIVPPTSR
ncbi:MAG: large conductance mechanosensitive channel protein MscL [Acidimicrobiia bacterium]|nr:large conductance mechanosensitive channel protein MscL [Acidimicrobiia bacterium]